MSVTTDTLDRLLKLARSINGRIPLRWMLPLPWDEFNHRARTYARELEQKRRRASRPGGAS